MFWDFARDAANLANQHINLVLDAGLEDSEHNLDTGQGKTNIFGLVLVLARIFDGISEVILGRDGTLKA